MNKMNDLIDSIKPLIQGIVEIYIVYRRSWGSHGLNERFN